jgi:hypothetical protein
MTHISLVGQTGPVAIAMAHPGRVAIPVYDVWAWFGEGRRGNRLLNGADSRNLQR